AMVGEIVKYAATDLVCYRAATPASLVAAQAAAWDPLLTWADTHLGVQLITTAQALAIDQPAESLARIEAAAHALDDLHLTALAFANGLAGSAIVALALIHRHIDGETAFRAIRVEEDWQAERWGRDPDEEKIAYARRIDLIAAERLVSALA
ncbi:MAG: ATPase, partial [Burkholderiales bacterium PBB4]